ncbi:ABC transporter substrate-binding protein [Deinococcus sp. Leaf326]|jgi:iron(III) transport system substrate-binding protein|uniref:ABC transporter substrate-binding protein n=1 Tax=Deinococcus sp. Leaf326 TaxID=1736338 RepID=UPI0006F3FDBC|nr:ABC transporter substrate-binding protein [Deinococcus sp. Leaf326]KQR00974.1 iron ABC transporter substrate-binding protein [Deinococcus sp. Leaf326]
MNRTFSLALLLSMTTASAQSSLTFVCGAQADWCQAVANAYKKETGGEAKFLRLSAGESLARLRAEKANPSFDVLFGGTGDVHEAGTREKLLTYYKPKAWNDLYPSLRQQVKNAYVPLYTGALGFAVNDTVLKRRNLPVPADWTDLGDPRYKGLVAMPNPNTSGTAYTMITTLIQIYGEKAAFDLLKKIHNNVPRNGYTRPGSGAAFLAARGEVAIGVTFMHDAVAQNVRGFPVRAVAPKSGTGTEIGGVSLVTGAPNAEAAKQFIDFVLKPETQKLAATVESFQIQSNSKTPVAAAAPNLSKIKLIDYDFAKWGDTATRARLISTWTKEVFPLPRR